MADKDIVNLIKKHDAERGGLFLDVLTKEGPAAALNFLVEDYRKVAELYGSARMQGGKTLQAECRSAAAKLALLARGVEQAESATPSRAAVPLASEVSTPESVAAAQERHGRVTAFVDEQAARGVTLSGAVAGEVMNGSGDVLGYLKGDESVQQGAPMFELVDPTPVPDDFEPAGDPPQGVDLSAAVAAGPDDIPGAEAFAASLPAGSATIELSDPDRPPGNVLTWDHLQALLGGGDPTVIGLPEHLSHSQRETLGECGTKYVMQRATALGVVQTPQWALIGGTAFHAAAEWFERLVAEVKTAVFVEDRLRLAGGLGEVWRRHFGQTVTDVAIANPQVPQERWRASDKGREGYTWWLVEGEAMLGRYISMRLGELKDSGATQPWRSIRWAEAEEQTGGEGPTVKAWSPMIEHEASMYPAGIEYKLVIDQVWEVGDVPEASDAGIAGMRKGDLLIDDLKSGKSVPVETGQLEEYAMWLSRFGGGQDRRIWGRFYNARKGTYTVPVDLTARMDWRRFEFETAAANAQKRAGVFAPRPTTFCGGCSVKHACPVFATIAT